MKSVFISATILMLSIFGIALNAESIIIGTINDYLFKSVE